MRERFLILMCLAGIWACADSGEPATPAISGQAIFEQYCVLCHGKDGKLGLNGAGDLSKSGLTHEERVVQITRGKGMMTPYQGILTPEEIEAVARYTQKLVSP